MSNLPYLSKKKGASSNPVHSIGNQSSSETSVKPEASAYDQDKIQCTRRLQKIIDQLQYILNPLKVGKIVDMLNNLSFVGAYSDLEFDESGLEKIRKDPGVLGLHCSSKMKLREINLTSRIIRIYYLRGKSEYESLPIIRFAMQSIIYYNGAEDNKITMDEISKKVLACIWIWQGFFETESNMNEPVLREEVVEMKYGIAKLNTDLRVFSEETKLNISKIWEELNQINARMSEFDILIKVLLDHFEHQR